MNLQQRPWLPSLGLTGLVLSFLVGPALVLADGDGFQPIFDGKTLESWDGDPRFWSVEEGAIVGRTTAEKPTKGNTFLIWRGGEVGDFELTLEYRILPENDKGFANSGIQYRSFEVEGQKWAVGGYQADFEAGDQYSGILYGERYRGILAACGQKTVIQEGGKVEVVGSVGDPKEIQSKIKKRVWNRYHIRAKDNHFVHTINGVVTSDATDEDSARRSTGILALQLHAGPPMKVMFRNIRLKCLEGKAKTAAKEKKEIVFLAGARSHGYGAHEHLAGCTLLAKSLQHGMPNFKTRVVPSPWPEDESIFAGADAVVLFADGGGRHPVIPHLQTIDRLADQGVGIVCMHYAVEIPKGQPGDLFLKWIGGYFEAHWSVNPHWTASFDSLPTHPITRGVKPYEANDEWYYHMRFRENMEGVTPILSALPGPETLKRDDGPHSGNPHVRAAVLERKEPQHLAWASERENGQRGFGFTGGHYHWNWGDPDYQKLLLNAIVWSAHGEVPEQGVFVGQATLEELESNQDYDPPAGHDRDMIRKRFHLP
jgi:3-keto-disaccharide hydrolase/trehalose utilization protein